MSVLRLRAGATAYQQINQHGLAAEHIAAVFGASGAAKWLTIYGLDKAIFSDWLTAAEQPINLFGTSVGAFKLAAAAQNDPAAALSILADAYIAQNYQGEITAASVSVETNKIFEAFLGEQAQQQLLANPRFHYHCASVRCLGWLASTNNGQQKAAMLKALMLSLAGRRFHHNTFERMIFSTCDTQSAYQGADGFVTNNVQLTANNLRAALLSSGSIPVLMKGVDSISGAPAGVYRDGGLLDYHALASNFSLSHPQQQSQQQTGLVLYPHFYPILTEGWFDKFWPWRKVPAAKLANTLIVSPSESFINSLPGGRIPERQDFNRFKNDDAERVRRWHEVKQRSLELGDAFLALLRAGDIASQLELIED
ncbi:MAG: hypothetical protein ACJAYG_001449 [Oceanicoccus sp.]|jgi:hypothetical protein